MNFLKFLIPSLIIITVLFQSCGDDTETAPIEFGYDYFPLEIGKYIEYDVDSIIYGVTTGNNSFRNNSIQLREEVTDSFLDSDGHAVYRIERFERKDDTEEWRINNVWTATVTDRQAERTEEDLRFIKMVFPVSDNTEPWDGNESIDENLSISVEGQGVFVFKHWIYQYDEIGVPLEVNSFSFDDVVTISQADENNFIQLRSSFEQYARGVGLVKREIRILDTQCIYDCAGVPWEEKAEKGFIVRQTVRDFN